MRSRLVSVFSEALASSKIPALDVAARYGELGGALLGHAYRYKTGVVVEVKAALPAVSSDHGPVHFTFSADSWSKLHRDRTAHYSNLDIIGWFHTHPDLGVFYSRDDVVVLSAAGKSFCAGVDLNTITRAANHTLQDHQREARNLALLLTTLNELAKPTIARVQGPAYGPGVGLVAAWREPHTPLVSALLHEARIIAGPDAEV